MAEGGDDSFRWDDTDKLMEEARCSQDSKDRSRFSVFQEKRRASAEPQGLKHLEKTPEILNICL